MNKRNKSPASWLILKPFRSHLLITALVLASSFISIPICQAKALPDLDAVTEKVFRSLSKISAQGGRSVLISPSDFYDLDSRECLPLSLELAKRLSEAFEMEGYHVAKASERLTKVWVINGQWKKQFNKWLALSFTLTPYVDGKQQKSKLVFAKMPLDAVPKSMFKPEMASYARTLVHRLALHKSLSKPQTVYLKPMNVGGVVGGTDSNKYFNKLLNEAISESNFLLPQDSSKALASVPKKTLRLRGIRPRKKASLSLTGDLMSVDKELSGNVAVAQGKDVNIQAELRGKDGKVTSKATVVIPVSYIPPDLSDDLDKAQNKGMAASAGNSKNGLTVEISTTRGEGMSTYHNEEMINFLIRVNRSAHVYLFDLDSDGAATLLYPAMDAPSKKLAAGQLLLLPQDGMAYDLVVSPPFGQDIVWAVATETPLDIPKELTGDWAKTNVLKKRIQDISADLKTGYSEAQVLVQTLQ